MLAMNYFGIIISALTFENMGRFMSLTNYSVPITLFVMLGLTRGLNLVGMANKKVKAMEAAKEDK